MNFHGKDIKIFTCNSNRPVAEQIAKILGLPVGQSEVTHFSDGEVAVSLHESVRGSECFIVQSTSTPVNDNIMELLIMIDAMKRASAARITAVIPYFGYARQDRKAKARDPISAKLVADGILRGASFMGRFMAATFTDLILRVVLAIIFSGTKLGSTGIWCAWPVGWSAATCISIFFYLRGPWYQDKQMH